MNKLYEAAKLSAFAVATVVGLSAANHEAQCRSAQRDIARLDETIAQTSDYGTNSPLMALSAAERGTLFLSYNLPGVNDLRANIQIAEGLSHDPAYNLEGSVDVIISRMNNVRERRAQDLVACKKRNMMLGFFGATLLGIGLAKKRK